MDFLKRISESIKHTYLVIGVRFESMGFQEVFSSSLLVRGGAWEGTVGSYESKTDSKLILTTGIWNLWPSNPFWELSASRKKSMIHLTHWHKSVFANRLVKLVRRNLHLEKWGGRCKEVRKMSFKLQWISCI